MRSRGGVCRRRPVRCARSRDAGWPHCVAHLDGGLASQYEHGETLRLHHCRVV